jgi:hypothetical protein
VGEGGGGAKILKSSYALSCLRYRLDIYIGEKAPPPLCTDMTLTYNFYLVKNWLKYHFSVDYVLGTITFYVYIQETSLFDVYVAFFKISSAN